jgi:hypothetical protein
MDGETMPHVPQRWAMGEQAKTFVAACLTGDPSALSPPREAAKEIDFAYDLMKARRK